MEADIIEKLQNEKRAAREYAERKYPDWNENYELYRNKVRTNQLVQRQAVNIPLMKETVKTLLSKIDDPPSIDWEELSGDEFKELVLQEKWNTWVEQQNLEAIDIQDKKTALIYGRPHKKLNWKNGRCELSAQDPFDVLIDPNVNPLDIESARFIIHQNIFKTLREVLADPRYTAEGKRRLKNFKFENQGIIISGKNREELKKKQERLRAMGVDDHEFATFGEGDTLVNITEQITHLWNPKKKEFEKYVVIYADDEIEMMRMPLKQAIGVDFYPYVTWSEDIETQDYFSDSIADLIRVPNKLLNMWFSQETENRTLKNFNMYWYDQSNQNYTPQTYEPGQGRMLPAPGNPKETLMKVDVGDLGDNLNMMEYVTRIVERATASTAIEKGIGEKNTQTLGEIQILVGKAMERTVAMAKFYRRSWYELAVKWYAMNEANSTKKEMLYKTDKNGKVWPKAIYPNDWKSKAGYRPIVRSTSEQEVEKTKTMQRFIYIQSLFPENKEIRKIMQARALDMVQVTPAELKAVEDEEDRIEQAKEQQAAQPQQQQATAQQENPVQLNEVQSRINELNTLQNA